MITPTIFWTVFAVMAVLLLWQQIYHIMEMRRLGTDNKDLRNRLAAKDLREYAGATRALDPQKADNTSEWTEEEKERAVDRIPIS